MGRGVQADALNSRVLACGSPSSSPRGQRFEIVQKAIVAGIPRLAFVGGPSSLSVDLARRFNLMLLGFVREEFNVYSGEVCETGY